MLLKRLRRNDMDLRLDMSMPGISGEDLLSRVHSRDPQLPILVPSMRNEVPIAQRALKAGATGYLTKNRDPETLLMAGRRLAAGRRFIDTQPARRAAPTTRG